MPKIAIIGTTSWGITLGIVLARKGLEVRLWARTEPEAIELRDAGPNPALLSGITFPPQLSVTSLLSEALAEAKVLILAVPCLYQYRCHRCRAGGRLKEYHRYRGWYG